jgi:hypothetical protein
VAKLRNSHRAHGPQQAQRYGIGKVARDFVGWSLGRSRKTIVERVRIESRAVASTPAEAAQMVLASPRACRTVLESLAVDGSAGRLGAWRAPLCALGRAGLLRWRPNARCRRPAIGSG